MSRLNKSDLDILVSALRCHTNKDYTLGRWNDYWHIYDKSNGESLIVGTARECYNYMQAYLAGISYAIDHMNAWKH